MLFVLQLVSIITDETPIEQMRNRLMKDRPNSGQTVHLTHTRKPKVALLREVFGRGKSAYICKYQSVRRNLFNSSKTCAIVNCATYKIFSFLWWSCSYAGFCLWSDLPQKLQRSCSYWDRHYH